MSAISVLSENFLYKGYRTIEQLVLESKGDWWDWGLCIRNGITNFQFAGNGWLLAYSAERIVREANRQFTTYDPDEIYVLHGIEQVSNKPTICFIKLDKGEEALVYRSNFRDKNRKRIMNS